MRDRVETRRSVAVVGAGIAGLAAAWALVRDGGSDVDVTVLDAAPTVGGKLAAGEVGGLVVDTGAESMLARRPEGVALAAEVGLADDLAHPATEGAWVWSRGALRRLPPGLVMGVPTDLRSLAASGVLSVPGLLRIPMDQVRRRTPVDDDVSIGALVSSRLGREVAHRLVEPLLGGVYAGHADEISLDAVLPQIARTMRVERSLLTAAQRQVGAADDTRPVFATVEGGMARLPLTLARRLEELGVEMRTGATVRELAATADGWQLVVGETRIRERLSVDAVVLAVPAAPASRLLASAAPAAAAELGAIESASVAIVTLVLPRSRRPVPGTGFLVPPVEGLTVKAATFSSAKWAWNRRADPDHDVVRLSIGRHREEIDLQHDDDELVALAVADLALVTGGPVRPVDALVSRWGGALPQYAVGHPHRVARILADVEARPGLAVCGAAYDGVGVPACVGSGQRAAAQVLRGLGRRADDETRQWSHG